jgi:predicted DNA-binding protein YlxM (UPF0122 family)
MPPQEYKWGKSLSDAIRHLRVPFDVQLKNERERLEISERIKAVRNRIEIYENQIHFYAHIMSHDDVRLEIKDNPRVKSAILEINKLIRQKKALQLAVDSKPVNKGQFSQEEQSDMLFIECRLSSEKRMLRCTVRRLEGAKQNAREVERVASAIFDHIRDYKIEIEALQQKLYLLGECSDANRIHRDAFGAIASLCRALPSLKSDFRAIEIVKEILRKERARCYDFAYTPSFEFERSDEDMAEIEQKSIVPGVFLSADTLRAILDAVGLWSFQIERIIRNLKGLDVSNGVYRFEEVRDCIVDGFWFNWQKNRALNVLSDLGLLEDIEMKNEHGTHFVSIVKVIGDTECESYYAKVHSEMAQTSTNGAEETSELEAEYSEIFEPDSQNEQRPFGQRFACLSAEHSSDPPTDKVLPHCLPVSEEHAFGA